MTFRRGLTLIELLVTIAILAMIVLVVSNLFISTTRLGRDEQGRIDVAESAGRVLGPLDEILRQGKEVLPSSVINSVTYTSSPTTLVFTLPSLDNTGGTIAGTSDTAVIYRDTTVSDNATIRLVINPANGTFRSARNDIIVEHVKDLYIRYTADTPAGAQAATLTVQITKTLQSQTFTRPNILYAVFRNHP